MDVVSHSICTKVINNSSHDTVIGYSPLSLALQHTEKSSIHNQQPTTHIHKNNPDFGPKTRKLRPDVTKQQIRDITNDIQDRKRRGIKYTDLLKYPHKHAETAQQARFILYNHKRNGTLFPSKHRTRPQEYISEQDAEQAAYNHHINNMIEESSTYNDPTGLTLLNITKTLYNPACITLESM